MIYFDIDKHLLPFVIEFSRIFTSIIRKGSSEHLNRNKVISNVDIQSLLSRDIMVDPDNIFPPDKTNFHPG